MGGRLRGWAIVLVSIACFLMLTGAARATSMLDFGIMAPTSGTISYAGGAAPLIGSGIDVDNVLGLPSGPAIGCVGCVLSFTTGSLTGTTGNSWSFGGGGTITVTGAVPAAGVGPSSVLLTGSFDGVTVINVAGVFDIAGAAFVDTKNSQLLSYFGLPDGSYDGNFGISFLALGAPPASFSSMMVLGGHIYNTPGVTAVPEPATAMLLGTALLGLVYFARPARSVPRSV